MSNFTKAFVAVNELLLSTRSLWQIVAFEHLEILWASEYPKLYQMVSQLSVDEIDSIDANHEQLVDLLLPKLIQDLSVSALSRSLFHARPDIVAVANTEKRKVGLERLASGIKGRKWQQITQFAQMIIEQDKTDTQYLEWCSGKGHLGRLVAKLSNNPVTSIEWQKSLCEQGITLAEKHNVKQVFVNADAFTQGGSLLKPQQHAFALHACGDLHIELLKQGVKAETNNLTIVPCCYHLTQSDCYQPISETARSSLLSLSKYDLRLPLQHSIVANNKHNELRNQEVHWRLSFDALQRELFANESYLPLPTIKQSQLNGTFENFVTWACSAKSLTLNTNVDLSKFLEIGKQRQQVAKQIDLVRHLFRYTLEMWLTYDRAMFLQEQGYQVSLKTFCDMTMTPRNIAIVAKRHSDLKNCKS